MEQMGVSAEGGGATYWTGEDPSRISRELRLYSRCGRAYLQLYYKHIDANGLYDSPLVEWRMQSEAQGSRIRLQHVMFAKYLCLNRRKRLTARYSGRSQRCLWVERLTGSGFTMLESDAFPGHFLGFGPNGKFLPPNQILQKSWCFHFLKLEDRSPLHAPYPGFSNPAFRPPTLTHDPDIPQPSTTPQPPNTTQKSPTPSPSSSARVKGAESGASESPWAAFAKQLASRVTARLLTVAPVTVIDEVLQAPPSTPPPTQTPSLPHWPPHHPRRIHHRRRHRKRHRHSQPPS